MSDKEAKSTEADDDDDDKDDVVDRADSEKSKPQPEAKVVSKADAEKSAAEKAAAKKLRHRPKWKLFWIVSVLSLIADQATKIWARASLPSEVMSNDSKICSVSAIQERVCTIPEDIASRCCAGEAVSVVDSFWHWRLSMNPGSAFGLFSGQGQVGRVLLSVVGVLAVFGMFWMLKKSRADQRILHWALALVAGGAVGNLIDRIYYGVVTDFVLWHWGSTTVKNNPNHFSTEWPVFNVADIVLVVGVGLMFIDIQKEGKREKEKKKRRQEKAKAAGLVKDL